MKRVPLHVISLIFSVIGLVACIILAYSVYSCLETSGPPRAAGRLLVLLGFLIGATLFEIKTEAVDLLAAAWNRRTNANMDPVKVQKIKAIVMVVIALVMAVWVARLLIGGGK